MKKLLTFKLTERHARAIRRRMKRTRGTDAETDAEVVAEQAFNAQLKRQLLGRSQKEKA